MPLNACLLGRSVLTVLTMLMLLLGVVPSAWAQEQEVEPATPLELDFERLLFDNQHAGLQDRVWQLTPMPGRRIVMLPFTVGEVDRPVELSRPPVSLRGGRFVGFFIPSAERGSAFDVKDRWRGLDRFTDDSPGALDRLLFGQAADEEALDSELWGDQTNPASTDGLGEGTVDTVDDDKPVTPESAPRLARKILIQPDGSVQWRLDRGFSVAQMQQGSEQNPYPFKLDPAMLRALEPPRAERIVRNEGEDTRDYALRKRQLQAEQRAKLDAYRDLRDALRDLPDQFHEPAPQVIYAILEVSERDELSLQGPPPMNWRLAESDRELINRLAQNTSGQFTDEQRQAMSGLNKLLDKKQALDERAVALAVMRSGVAGQVQENGPGFRLISKLLASDDKLARRVAIYAVARAQPQSSVCAKLLAVAGQSAQGTEQEVLQLASLRTLFAVELPNPNRADAMVAAINQALESTDGPAPGRVMEELLIALGALSQGGVEAEAVNRTYVKMVNGVGFMRVPADQLDALIAVLIRYSPENQVASSWLDVKLLRTGDAALIGKTLASLSKSDDLLTRQVESTNIDFVQPSPNEAEPTKTMKLSIPLDSANHGLIRALDSTDAAQRALAWDALGHFRVAPSSATSDPDQAAKIFERILAKGVSQEKTPSSLVDFIDNHSDPQFSSIAPRAMLMLLAGADVDPAISTRAAKRVVDAEDEYRYAQAISALDPAAQLRVVNALYLRLGEGGTPLVVGLVADPGSGLVNWFMQHLAEEGLPTARQWAAQASGGEQGGGEQRLLQLATGDNASAASAAAAALVINAGGSAEDQAQFAQKIGQMDPRDYESVNAAWSSIKTGLYAKALASAKGTYKLVVIQQPAEGGLGLEPAVPTRIELGVVEFKADGNSVSLSVEEVDVAVSDQRLAIQLKSVSSLRSFPNPQLKGLPLSQIDEPMDLLPQDGGAWRGKATLPDGGSIEVMLEPVE